MAKEDFCFTYYDGDATREMAHMNRLERGAYNDVVIQQRQRGHLSKDDLKKFLSKDFDIVWEALEWVLKIDDQGKYFIEWLDNSIKKAAAHSKKQRKNISKRYQQDTKPLPNKDLVEPLEDGYGNGDEDGYVDEKENFEKSEKLLVPEMIRTFKKFNPSYPSDAFKDSEALQRIAVFICEQSGSNYYARDKLADESLFELWGKISEFVSSHNFFKNYSLYQVEKHIQSITQEIKNGQSTRQNTTKKVTGADLDKAFAKRYS